MSTIKKSKITKEAIQLELKFHLEAPIHPVEIFLDFEDNNKTKEVRPRGTHDHRNN